jgi:hypothetical protein
VMWELIQISCCFDCTIIAITLHIFRNTPHSFSFAAGMMVVVVMVYQGPLSILVSVCCHYSGQSREQPRASQQQALTQTLNQLLPGRCL